MNNTKTILLAFFLVLSSFCTLPVKADYICAGSVTVKQGETATINLASTYARTLRQSTGVSYQWRTANSSYVQVRSYTQTSATIYGVSVTNSGKVYFDCSYWIDRYYRTMKFYYDVTVTSSQVFVHNIELNKTSVTMTEGETLQLNAYVFPTTATYTSVGWSSSNKNVATVNSSGKVTAKSAGNVRIYCTAKDGSGVTEICYITVKAKTGFEQETDGTLKGTGEISLSSLTNAFTKYTNITVLDLTEATLSDSITADTISNLLSGNVLAYLPANSGLSGKNIVADGKCEKLVLTDGNTFTQPTTSFVANTVSYSRKMKNEWGTIYLPYTFEKSNGIELYEISDVDDGILFVKQKNHIEALTPALIHITENDSVISFTADSVTISSKSSNLRIISTDCLLGSFTQDKKITNTNSYYIKNNRFVLANEYFYVDAFRAYLYIYSSSASSREFAIRIDDDLSGISNDQYNEDARTIVGIFSLNGIRREKLKTGINIVRYSDGSSTKIILQ